MKNNLFKMGVRYVHVDFFVGENVVLKVLVVGKFLPAVVYVTGEGFSTSV